METMWLKRYYESTLKDYIKPGRVLVLYGPRRTGKTTLIKDFLKGFEGNIFSGTGDDMLLRNIMMSRELHKIMDAFSPYDLIFIDEAQHIPEVGHSLKMLVDHAPEKKVIVTGSSSLDLSTKIGEPLTGRHDVRILYPLSVMELNGQFGSFEVQKKLEDLMVFGGYPDVINAPSRQDKIEYLSRLRDSLLLKDIIELENLRYSEKLIDLLKLLAYQIGNEVSLNELSNQLGIAKNSIARYLYLLEKAFIIRNLKGFSRNLRNEVTKTSRYYFWDNGIRNAVINDFNSLDFRNDLGMLWENFLFIERQKRQEYKRILSNVYFWRTYQQHEIDLVEERDGKLYGFEFKWTKEAKPPKLWLETYPGSEHQFVNRDNFLTFVS
jgi:predicted AAA+ superfamily ATPase